MSFARPPHPVHVHMWIGLILGLLLAALGLSGSLLVYDDAIANLLNRRRRAPPKGKPLPLAMIQDIAARERGGRGGQMQIFLPQEAGRSDRGAHGQISPMGNMPGMTRPMAKARPRGRRAPP